MEEERQHQQAFGGHTGISKECRNLISLIKDNNPYQDELELYNEDTDNFTNFAWRLFGRYVANNTHLKEINLDKCYLTDEIMSILFRELVRSSSLKSLLLNDNEFGIEGVRSMIPLLQNSPQLSDNYLYYTWAAIGISTQIALIYWLVHCMEGQ